MKFSFLLITSLLYFQTLGQLLIALCYSLSTDLHLKSSIYTSINKEFNNEIELSELFITAKADLSDISQKFNIMIDLTSSISISAALKEFAKENFLLLISVENQSSLYEDWQFFTHISNKDHIAAISAIARYLSWDKFIIIFGEESVRFANELKDEFLFNQTFSYFFSNKENQEVSDNFVGKEIKPTGIRNIIILNQGEGAARLISSLKLKNLIGSGSGIIFGSSSLWGANEDWLLGYTESGLENANNYYIYEAISCIKLIKKILSFSEISDNFALREVLEENTIDHRPIPEFTLINTDRSKKKYVGVIVNNKLILNDTLIFPGNLTATPNSPSTQINIWIGEGVINPGFPNSKMTYEVKYGSHYALQYAKNNHFLEGFEITTTTTDCGAEIYVPKFSLNCFSKLKSKPGIGYLTSPFAGVIIGNLISMKALNISMPLISEYTTPFGMGNQTLYPDFMKIAGYDLYHISVLINLICIFDWKNIIVILENSTSNFIIYERILSWTNTLNINIVNKPEDRWAVQNYNHSRYNDNKEWMQRIIDLKVRPILFFVTPPGENNIIIDFYNAGLRMGNGIFLIPNRIAFTQLYATDSIMMQKMFEMLYGSIIINEAEWIGDYGQEMLNGFLKFVYPFTGTDFECLSFDAAMLLLNGIKYTLNLGENLENSAKLNSNLRQQRFLGCSGRVSIESGTNNRNAATLGIYNMRWNATTGKLYESLCGVYDVGRKQLFTFFDNLIWYNNQTAIPEDKVMFDGDCHFDKSEIQYSYKGALIFYAICGCIAIISGISAFWIWKVWWNIDIPELVEMSKIQFEDYIAMIIIFIDFLQFLSMGPSLSGYDIASSNLSDWISINFEWFTKGKQMWNYVNAALITVGIWVWSSMQNLGNCYSNSNSFLIVWCRTLAKIALPVIGNICFLPIVSILLNVFACFESTGSEISQTFVHRDCSTFCWQDSHIVWAVLSAISLAVYVPSAIYFRPFGDYINHANIKARPLFLILKSLLQIYIIILAKTVRVYYGGLHGICYILLLLIFIGFCIKKKPYNYNRMNLWSIISYIAIMWSVAISSIFSISKYTFMPLWLTFEFAGWAILIGIGVFIDIKLLPSMLFDEDKIDISILFKFQLGNKVTPDIVNKSLRDFNMKKYLYDGKKKIRLSSCPSVISEQIQTKFMVESNQENIEEKLEQLSL